MLFKIKRDTERDYLFTTILYDQQMKVLKKSGFEIKSPDRDVVLLILYWTMKVILHLENVPESVAGITSIKLNW